MLAALNHARILVAHGLFWNYGGVGWPSALYWSGLTLVDPLVALLLLVRPRVGVPATAVVIATNVIHNLWVTARFVPDGEVPAHIANSPALLSQIGFLIFVAATYRSAMAGTDRAFR